MIEDVCNDGPVRESYRTDEFYMGDAESFDSFVGLYFGHLESRINVAPDGSFQIAWRAECPWTWPSYGELFQQYGRHGAQRFSIPNAYSLLTGRQDDSLMIGDGLGGHLTEIGAAKPFLVFSEWTEPLIVPDTKNP